MVRHPFFIGTIVATAIACGQPAYACQTPNDALNTSRIVQVDASNGPMYGRISRFASEPQFLRSKEIVLTFDDGPSPRLTRSILATLAKYCAKATFFPVGRMAMAYPQIMQEIAQQGHTIGGHTWSHPNNMRRLAIKSIEKQIERGFAAVAAASQQPISPFFRFPGLNDDGRALRYLQKRGIATFSVDVVSDDSYISDVEELVQTTLSRIKQQGRGILLFHDIKSVTAEALPQILEGLKNANFNIVHLTSKFTLVPNQTMHERLAKKLKSKTKQTATLSLAGFQGTVRVREEPQLRQTAPPVTHLAPERRKVELAKLRAKRVRNLIETIDGRAWTSIIEHKKTNAAQPSETTN